MYRLAVLAFAALPLAAQQYDVVLANGRVMDPASNLDGVRFVGITAGKIAAISATPLRGRETVDVKGLVVAPGFIDIHQHRINPENYAFKARDGVTTVLEMEVGVSPVPPWYAEREGHSLINFGASVGHIPALMTAMHDTGTFLPHDAAANRVPTAAEHQEALQLLRRGLQDGALGIGMGIAYVKETRAQILDVFRLAAETKSTIFVHMRNSGPVEPGAIDSLQEVLADAAATGASLHVVHITSTCLAETPVCLQMIAGARKRGMDVTTEAYPYTAGMTDLASAIFDEGWQNRLGHITYGDLQWAATGERLTAESFARYRKQGGMVAIHGIPEDVARMAMADSTVLIASDGILDEGKGHPRAAGTFARVLGRYVREQHALTLMLALNKMTAMPAARLGLKNKGRLAVGADADITVFDPAKVTDRATFDSPAQYSEGISYVLVNGTFVVKASQLQNVTPGRSVRR